MAASYVFFWSLSHHLLVFLLVTTLNVYVLGLALERAKANGARALRAAEKGERRRVEARLARRRALVVALAVLVNVGMLAACKYLVFFAGLLGSPWSDCVPRLGLPIGISFYTLMAVSYVVDVARGKTCADRHLGRVALYLAFFPQIMEGPLSRYEQTAQQLTDGAPIEGENLYRGCLRIAWGVAKKVVVADRLNALVVPVFGSYEEYNGTIIAFGAIVYTVQLYCDFSGTIDMALGMGRVFGVALPENFRGPFFSRTASEFWQRWHITLGVWLRDYVYYPLVLSRPLKKLTMRARRRLGNRFGPLATSAVALFAVWVINGLWHGAGRHYLLFGMYYLAIIVLGGFADPVAQSVAPHLHVNRNGRLYHVFQHVRTLAIVIVGELIFRAEGLRAALLMLGRLVCDFNPSTLCDGSLLALGLAVPELVVAAVAFGVVVAVDVLAERGHDVMGLVSARGVAVRGLAFCTVVLLTIVFGAYGGSWVPVDPIYAQF